MVRVTPQPGQTGWFCVVLALSLCKTQQCIQPDSKIIWTHLTSSRLSREKAARESTYVCNQAAGLSRCLSKVQQGKQTQLKTLQTTQAKGKLANKTGAATEELQYLMNFSNSIRQCCSQGHGTPVRFHLCLHGQHHSL